MAASACKSLAERRGDALKRLRENGQCTTPDAALLLYKSKPTIKKWIALGWLRAVRIGNRWYITSEEIERFKKEGAYKAVTDSYMLTSEEG